MIEEFQMKLKQVSKEKQSLLCCFVLIYCSAVFWSDQARKLIHFRFNTKSVALCTWKLRPSREELGYELSMAVLFFFSHVISVNQFVLVTGKSWVEYNSSLCLGTSSEQREAWVRTFKGRVFLLTGKSWDHILSCLWEAAEIVWNCFHWKWLNWPV